MIIIKIKIILYFNYHYILFIIIKKYATINPNISLKQKDVVNEKGEPTGRLLPGTRLTIMEELLMVRDAVMDS